MNTELAARLGLLQTSIIHFLANTGAVKVSHYIETAATVEFYDFSADSIWPFGGLMGYD